MKAQSIITLVFAIILLSVGFYGFYKTGSLPSLIMSSIFSAIFMVSSHFIYRNKLSALFTSALSLLLLNIVFLIRFVKTMAFFPAGLFVILTTILGAIQFNLLTNAIKRGQTN